MKKRTLTQNKELHSILGKKGIKGDEKADLVHSYTNGRTESSAEMSYEECRQLILDLKGETYETWAYFDKENKQHMKIMSIAHQLGWTIYKEEKGEVVNLATLGGWLKNYGHLRRPLNYYTHEELSKLIHQMEQIKLR